MEWAPCSRNLLALFGRPHLMRVCWVSSGAWLLGRRSNYDCIWLAKSLPLCCCALRLEGKSQVGIIPICVSSDGRMLSRCTIFHNCLLLELASMHPVYLVGSLF